MQPVPGLVETPVAQAAIRLAQSTESPSVFNHSVRSYLFAELIAVRDGMRPGSDYSSEAVFLGCVLHDLGVSTGAPGKARFEVEGADLAAVLLTDHGADRDVVDGVWEAIALHTSGGIAERRGALCYLVRNGVGADFGRNAEFIDERTATAIHHSYPRLSMASTLVDAIVEHAQRSPDAAPPYSMPGELLRERRTDGTSLIELMASHGRWAD
ncbi:MAG TPA: HD domain-containing protein [Mycobacterium sp.]